MAVPARALWALRLPVPPDKPQPRAVFPRHALVAPRLQLVAANTSTRRATDSSRVSQQHRLPPTGRFLFHHTEAHGALIDWNSGVEPRPTAMFQRSACFQRVHKPSNSPQIVALSPPPLLFWRALGSLTRVQQHHNGSAPSCFYAPALGPTPCPLDTSLPRAVRERGGRPGGGGQPWNRAYKRPALLAHGPRRRPNLD